MNKYTADLIRDILGLCIIGLPILFGIAAGICYGCGFYDMAKVFGVIAIITFFLWYAN